MGERPEPAVLDLGDGAGERHADGLDDDGSAGVDPQVAQTAQQRVGGPGQDVALDRVAVGFASLAGDYEVEDVVVAGQQVDAPGSEIRRACQPKVKQIHGQSPTLGRRRPGAPQEHTRCALLL
ncbi:hypothetical protein NMG29_09470 [Streptomyces cocklensis]|uniref:hypothetical protein n=1 Tax=Actinacidiphila cocklensis TaxID=887465 RepID=UPI00203CAEE7|nr:hypothetical protein [Actinacidiphila cocklensis]MDD1058446.1 hypothetical protein [Actinacidiphila cocklensis]